MKYCSNCLMPETRPRITYNEKGVCNACQWAEEKKQKLIGILDGINYWKYVKEIKKETLMDLTVLCLLAVGKIQVMLHIK